jgi:hypothetical protein
MLFAMFAASVADVQQSAHIREICAAAVIYITAVVLPPA